MEDDEDDGFPQKSSGRALRPQMHCPAVDVRETVDSGGTAGQTTCLVPAIEKPAAPAVRILLRGSSIGFRAQGIALDAGRRFYCRIISNPIPAEGKKNPSFSAELLRAEF